MCRCSPPFMSPSPSPRVSALRISHPRFLSLDFARLVMSRSVAHSLMFLHPIPPSFPYHFCCYSYTQDHSLGTCPARIHCARSSLPLPLSSLSVSEVRPNSGHSKANARFSSRLLTFTLYALSGIVRFHFSLFTTFLSLVSDGVSTPPPKSFRTLNVLTVRESI